MSFLQQPELYDLSAWQTPYWLYGFEVVLKLVCYEILHKRSCKSTARLNPWQNLIFSFSKHIYRHSSEILSTLINNHLSWQWCRPLINFLREQKWNDYAPSNQLVDAGFRVKRAWRFKLCTIMNPLPAVATSSHSGWLEMFSLTTIFAPLSVKTSGDSCTTALLNCEGKRACECKENPQRTCVCVCVTTVCDGCDWWVEGKPRGDFR